MQFRRRQTAGDIACLHGYLRDATFFHRYDATQKRLHFHSLSLTDFNTNDPLWKQFRKTFRSTRSTGATPPPSTNPVSERETIVPRTILTFLGLDNIVAE